MRAVTRSNAFARARKPLRAAPKKWPKRSPIRATSSSGSRKRARRRKPRPRAAKISSPTRRRSSARAERSSSKRGSVPRRSIARSPISPSEQQALVTAVEESRARRAAAVARQGDLAATREDFEQQRRDQQERVAAARASAEKHREEAQAIAIKVESRRSSKESASAALLRVQSQLAHLTKRQQELKPRCKPPAPRCVPRKKRWSRSSTSACSSRRISARRARRWTRSTRSCARPSSNATSASAPSTRFASSPTTCGSRFANRRFEPRRSPSSSRRRASSSTRSRSGCRPTRRRPLDGDVRVARAEDSAARRDQSRGDRRVPGAIRAQEVPRRAVHGPHGGARDARERDPQDRS